MSTDAPTTEVRDNRQKVDHDLVLKLRAEGKKASEIAEEGLASNGEKVAVGTIYKILRESGQGSGRTINRGPRGVNVASDLESMVTKLQSQIDDADKAKEAETVRHTEALAAIDKNVADARVALETMKKLTEQLTPTDNGSEAKSESDTPAVAGKGKSAK